VALISMRFMRVSPHDSCLHEMHETAPRSREGIALDCAQRTPADAGDLSSAALARASTGIPGQETQCRRGVGLRAGRARVRHPTRTLGRAAPTGDNSHQGSGREAKTRNRSCDGVCGRTRATAPVRRLPPKTLFRGSFSVVSLHAACASAHSPWEGTPHVRQHAASAFGPGPYTPQGLRASPTTLHWWLILSAR
jgi:hypothetical protein